MSHCRLPLAIERIGQDWPVLARIRSVALRVGVVGLATASLGGCVLGKACTDVGAISGVGLDLPTGLWTLQEFCVDDVCTDLTEPWHVPVGDEPAEYEFRLSAESSEGALLRREGVVATKEYFVNGKGCDPRTAHATIVVDAAGTVNVIAP